jgi:hypothetical protein
MQEYRVEVDALGSESWFNKEGKNHRENGPAVVSYNGHEEYWIDGKQRPNPNVIKELTVAEIEELLGYRVKVVK